MKNKSLEFEDIIKALEKSKERQINSKGGLETFDHFCEMTKDKKIYLNPYLGEYRIFKMGDRYIRVDIQDEQ